MTIQRPSFFAELQRRNVYKVGAMYAVAGWLVVQVVTQVFPIFHVSELVQRIIVLAIVAGFPLALVLSWIYELTPQGIVKTDEVAPDASITTQTGRKLNRAIIGVLVLAVLVMGARLLWPREAPAPVATEAALPAANQHSIAVLPFENLSDDQANAYFAEGIQDEILTRLAGVGDLKVISRTSTEKYKSHPDNLKTVAEELGVGAILEGSVQKAGGKIRVNVQLIDAHADTHLWASIYDRDLNDVFAVESEVSQSIVEALKARLSPGETQALATVPTRNREAYDLFLKGEYALHRAVDAQNNAALYDQAAGYYRQALALDPDFAQAGARLAYAMLSRGWFVETLSAAGLEQVKAVLDHALALQPDLPEVHEALGAYHYWGFRDYEAAQAEFRRALTLKPSDAGAWYFMALVDRRRARWPQALADFEQAARLAPRDADIAGDYGATLLSLRRYAEAESALDRALALDPESLSAKRFLAATIVQSTGDVERARKVFQSVPPEQPVTPRFLLGGVEFDERIYLDVLQGRFDQALQAWNGIAASTPRDQVLRQLGLITTRLLAGQQAAAQSDCTALDRLLQSPASPLHAEELPVAESWIQLCLGNKDAALQAAQQVADHLPPGKDAMYAPYTLAHLAKVASQAGRPEIALPVLSQLLSMPAGITMSVTRLKLDPVWDPLRGDPRFQQLLKGSGQ